MILLLALSTAWADPCDDLAELAGALPETLDATDRAAAALRDAHAVVLARAGWDARVGHLRAVGEASAQEAVDGIMDQTLRDLADSAYAADGTGVALGGSVSDIPLPNLPALADAPPADAVALHAEQSLALLQGRAALLAATDGFVACGLPPVERPPTPTTSSPFAGTLQSMDQLHVAVTTREGLTTAATVTHELGEILARMYDLSRTSASEPLDNGLRYHLQRHFETLSAQVDDLVGHTHHAGHPLLQGVDTPAIALPDLSAPTLGVDTGTMDLTTATGGAVSMVSAELGAAHLAEVRRGHAEDRRALRDAIPPLHDLPPEEGAMLPAACDDVASATVSLDEAAAQLASWEADAARAADALATLHALALHDASELQGTAPRTDEAAASLASLVAHGSVVVALDHGVSHTVVLPTLPTAAADDEGLAAQRTELQRDRWTVHAEALRLLLHGTRLAREARLCDLPPPVAEVPGAPMDADDRELHEVVADNVAAGLATLDAHLAHLDAQLGDLRALRYVVDDAGNHGVTPAHQDQVEALLASMAAREPSVDGWPLDLPRTVATGIGRRRELPGSVSSPTALGLDDVDLSTGWQAVSLVATAIDDLAAQRTEVAASRDELRSDQAVLSAFTRLR